MNALIVVVVGQLILNMMLSTGGSGPHDYGEGRLAAASEILLAHAKYSSGCALAARRPSGDAVYANVYRQGFFLSLRMLLRM